MFLTRQFQRLWILVTIEEKRVLCCWVTELFYRYLKDNFEQIFKLEAYEIPGTEYVSSIWNSGGWSSVFGERELSRFINILSRSKFSPVTLDTYTKQNKFCNYKLGLLWRNIENLPHMHSLFHNYLKNWAKSFRNKFCGGKNYIIRRLY